MATSYLSLRWRSVFVAVLLGCQSIAAAGTGESLDLWGDQVPGEIGKSKGTELPRRIGEDPPATRVGDITQPSLDVYLPATEKACGTAVLVFPGGGYNYVVVDKEGSEPAKWLNSLGVTTFVLRYRTKVGNEAAPWARPLQDAQRAVSLVRSRREQWGLKSDRIGVLGFSAGGNLAARVANHSTERTYPAQDLVDESSSRPDFTLLAYPWKLEDASGERLGADFQVTPKTPPTFLVHTHDDGVTSQSSVLFYSALKKQGVPAELHIFETGGHGYGIRKIEGSQVHTWTDHASAWMRKHNLIAD